MGGVTSSMATKLAFFPPNPPSYKLVKEEATGLLLLDPFPLRENVEVLKFSNRRGTKIVAMYVRHPMAKTTILYSHGNVVDIGQMYELFIELSIHDFWADMDLSSLDEIGFSSSFNSLFVSKSLTYVWEESKDKH